MESEELEDDGLFKFRVVAAGRIPPVTVLAGQTVYVGPVDDSDNGVLSPSPLQEVPLPRVLASHVPYIAGTSELDPVAWSAIASQALSQGGSNLVKWRRDVNQDLNSEPHDGTSFRWDVKLCRYMTPKYDPEDPSLQNNKCKNSRRIVNELWRLLYDNRTHPLMQTDLRNAVRQGDWHLTPVDVLEEELVSFVGVLLDATRGAPASLQGGKRVMSIPPLPPLPRVHKKKGSNA